MSLPTNNKITGKQTGKTHSNNGGSKFLSKPGTKAGGGATKKPVKTGGSRGS